MVGGPAFVRGWHILSAKRKGAAVDFRSAPLCVNVTSATQVFMYTYTGVYPERSRRDELNRISTAVTQATTGLYAWGLSFGYDPWANLLNVSVTQGSAFPLSVSTDPSHPNRLSGYSYL